MINLRTILFILSLCSSVSLLSQDIAKDIKKVNDAYLLNDSYSFNMKYELYKDKAFRQVLEVKKGNYIKNKDQQISILDGYSSIYLKDCFVMIDKSSKTIYINDPIKIADKSFSPLAIDSLLNANVRSKYLGIKNGEKVYEFSIINSNYMNVESVKIYIDTKTYFISKMSYNISEPANYNDDKVVDKVFLIIDFYNIKLNPAINKSIFNKSYYIGKNSNSIYKSYSVVNNLKSN